jgi:hypothetical protein
MVTKTKSRYLLPVLLCSVKEEQSGEHLQTGAAGNGKLLFGPVDSVLQQHRLCMPGRQR